jgi:hypothetical protein
VIPHGATKEPLKNSPLCTSASSVVKFLSRNSPRRTRRYTEVHRGTQRCIKNGGFSEIPEVTSFILRTAWCLFPSNSDVHMFSFLRAIRPAYSQPTQPASATFSRVWITVSEGFPRPAKKLETGDVCDLGQARIHIHADNEDLRVMSTAPATVRAIQSRSIIDEGPNLPGKVRSYTVLDKAAVGPWLQAIGIDENIRAYALELLHEAQPFTPSRRVGLES